MIPTLALTLAVLAITPIESKFYSRCEFVQYLSNYGTPRDQIPTWSCIASHESNYNTQAINPDSGDYGILQISKKYWCSDSNTPGNGCGITCDSLLGDDIAIDLDCARKVYDDRQSWAGNGFTAWTTYPECQGDNSQYVAGCNY